MTTEQADPAIDNFLLMANALPEAVLLLTAGGAIVGGNQALASLLKVSAGDIRGWRLQDIATSTGSIPEYLRACARSTQLLPATLVFFPDLHKIECRADGSVLRPRAVDARALVLLRMKQKTAAVQTFLALNRQIEALTKEVHQRKQAEDQLQRALRQKEVLLREVHHRVKNNMQVISAMIELHSLDVADSKAMQALQEVRSRINVMAQVHQRLCTNEHLEEVDLHPFLQDLIPELVSAYKSPGQEVSLVLALDSVKSGLDTALACGLLVHELIANSLEHAFPYARAGTVEVALYANDAGRGAVLRVSDDGVGLPYGFDLAAAESIGMQLVNSLVRQMRGSIALDTTKGTTFTITFGG